MNERIRELAEQAFNEANNGSISGIKIPKEFIEKFAELIVRECADIADRESSQPCASYGELIKQHFGVEE